MDIGKIVSLNNNKLEPKKIKKVEFKKSISEIEKLLNPVIIALCMKCSKEEITFIELSNRLINLLHEALLEATE